MENLCDSLQLQCKHVQHFEMGYELLTEQIVLDYCKEEHRSSHMVSYIHSKGSLHPNDDQIRIRRMMTEQTTSKECFDRLDDNQCNVCVPTFDQCGVPPFGVICGQHDVTMSKSLFRHMTLKQRINLQ